MCNRSFTDEMANLVCYDLGFAKGASHFTTRYEYNLNNRKKLTLKDDLLVARLRCPKKAASLAYCTRTLITKVFKLLKMKQLLTVVYCGLTVINRLIANVFGIMSEMLSSRVVAIAASMECTCLLIQVSNYVSS